MTNPKQPRPLVEQVKTYFNYLFTELGFVVADSRENSKRGYAEVLLESRNCYIKFSQSRDEWDMQMTVRHTPPQPSEWLPAGQVYNYVTQAPVNIEESLKPQPILSPEESLKQWAETFRPVAAQAVAFFNPAGFEQRLQDYKQFVAEQSAEARRQLQDWQARHPVHP